MTTKNYHQLIAAILSFKTDEASLEKALKQPQINWESFVFHSSSQLVLPTVYCRLLERDMLCYLPEDLQLYMAQFTSINRNRNKAILNQIKALTALLDGMGISYVYLKGAAMLAGGFYKDIGERMISDIDVLVEEAQFLNVYNFFKTNDYYPFGGRQFLLRRTGKHLPPMVKDDSIAAVEIHRWLFNHYRCPFLSEAEVLDNARPLAYPIPAQRDLLLHNMLNWQVNDKAYANKIIGFRAIYDTLLIAGKAHEVRLPVNHNYLKAYTSIAAQMFKEFEPSFTWSALIFKWNGQSQRFNTVFCKVNNFKTVVVKRIQHYSRWINLLVTSKFHQQKAILIFLRKLKPKPGVKR